MTEVWMEEEGVYVAQRANVVLQHKKFLITTPKYRGRGQDTRIVGVAMRLRGTTRGNQGMA